MRSGPPERISTIFKDVFANAFAKMTANCAALQDAAGRGSHSNPAIMNMNQGPSSHGQAVRPVDDGVIDEFAMEERQAYQAKVSKWLRGSMVCLSDCTFWFLIHAANEARKPLTMFYSHLCVDSSHAAYRNDGPTSELPIVKLITQRIEEVHAEFRRLLETLDTWTDALISAARTACAPLASGPGPTSSLNAKDAKGLALRMVLHNQAAFDRRIVRLLQARLVCES